MFMRLFQKKSDERVDVWPGEQTPPEALLVGSVLFITALLYAATLSFSFVYDDEGQIVQNVSVHFWRFVPGYFRGAVWQFLFPHVAENYYRPLNLLWFRVNDAIFGLHPLGWHATAVGLHLLVTFLAYKVARKVTNRPLVATLTALIFAVHPMRHEVVAWVSGTTESLWAVFFFAAFLAYLKSREVHRISWMALSCVLYAFGLLSKETAIVLPALVFAYAWIYDNHASEPGWQKNWQRFSRALKVPLAYIPLVILYLVVRIHVLHGFSHVSGAMSLKKYAFTVPSVIFFYAKQWLLPVHLSAFYDVSTWTSFSVRHVLFPLLGICVIAVVIWFFRRQLGTREVAFAAVFILIPLAPALDLFAFMPVDLVHDRYFYVPGFGAALLVALAFEKLARGKVVWHFPQRWLVAALALLALLCYDTANATRYWTNNYDLYSHDIQIAPQNFVLRVNYGSQLVARGDYAHAMPIFQKLLKEDPKSYLVNEDLGRLLYLLHMYPAAEHYLETSRGLAPWIPGNYLDLALVDLRTNRLSQAETNIRQAITLRPYEPMFHFALGTVLAQQGMCAQASPEFATALEYNPEFPKAREMMDKCRSDSDPAQGDPGGNAKASQVPRPAAHALAKTHADNDPSRGK